MTARPPFDWIQRGLLVLGILLLTLWSRSYLESRGFQSAESRKFAAELRAAEPRSSARAVSDAAFVGPTAIDRAEPGTGSRHVLGRLEVPRLAITAIVAEGADLPTLRHAVGHIASTALPGNPGNCALAGHRDTFLRGLGAVRVNDVIRLVTLQRTYLYEVEWIKVVEPRRVDVIDSTTTPSLTLVTCYPFVWVGHAPRRFIVRAKQVETFPGTGTFRDALK